MTFYFNSMMDPCRMTIIEQVHKTNYPTLQSLFFCDAFHAIVQDNLHKYQKGINQVIIKQVLKN